MSATARVFRILDFSAISKAISIRIDPVPLLVAESDRFYTQLRQSKQFLRLRYCVVVLVLPQTESGEYSIAAIYDAISIAAVLGLIKFRQRQKPVSVR